MRRVIAVIVISLGVLPGAPAVAADPCTPRSLVVSAFPGEIDMLLHATHVSDTVVLDGRAFYTGTLRGNDVVLALTGIGLVNAEATTRTALEHFTCGEGPGIDRIVFSGVAGGKTFIGDVTVPDRWTLDDGKTWLETDDALLDVASLAVPAASLSDVVPLGDVACAGLDPDLVSTINLPKHPSVIIGGDGKSADSFGGRAFPCFPGGGDVFGCEPCRAPQRQVPDVNRFVHDAEPFVDPDFFFGYFASPPPPGTSYAAEDMETGAVAKVAAEQGVPFIAFRAMSDGDGDPLMLPGFPFQFFVYRQIAADNAARMTLAFLARLAA